MAAAEISFRAAWGRKKVGFWARGTAAEMAAYMGADRNQFPPRSERKDQPDRSVSGAVSASEVEDPPDRWVPPVSVRRFAGWFSGPSCWAALARAR